MGWIVLFLIVVLLIWYWNRWYGSPTRIMGRLNDLSELFCKMIFEKLATDIDVCKKMREDFKGNKEFTQELKRHEDLVFSFLSMIHKHEEVKEYVYIMKSDKETLDIERDWYRYCRALFQLVGLKDRSALGGSDPYFDRRTDEIWQQSSIAMKEVEKKFDEILLRRVLRRNGTLKDDATNI